MPRYTEANDAEYHRKHVVLQTLGQGLCGLCVCVRARALIIQLMNIISIRCSTHLSREAPSARRAANGRCFKFPLRCHRRPIQLPSFIELGRENSADRQWPQQRKAFKTALGTMPSRPPRLARAAGGCALASSPPSLGLPACTHCMSALSSMITIS